MWRKFFLLALLSLFCLWSVHSQNSLRLQARDTLLPWKPVVRFDSVSVWPDSIKIYTPDRQLISDSTYKINAVLAEIRFKDTLKPADSIHINYYRYPEIWYGTGNILRLNFHQNPVQANAGNQKSLLDGMQTSGFWEQGMMAGNRQNPVPQNRMDLIINGPVTGKVRLQAHIKDDNLPMGYDGITTTFKDLNRIYVRVLGPGWQVSGGDTLWRYQSPLFAFARDNQGIGADYNGESLQTGTAVALQKGRYGRQEIKLKTGEYGPFSLQNNQGENDIYILHGSEKVFLNGRLLHSGPDKDYQMDYMRSQIRLNPNLDINTGDRLTVEFQYAAREFVRWSSFEHLQWQNGKSRWEWFWYNETDNKHRTLLTPLDSNAIAYLQHSGNAGQVWIPGWQTASPAADVVLYYRVNGHFVYAPHPGPQDSVYKVRFSYVGSGKGDYVLDRYLAGGAVFSYAGTRQGDYVPYVRITPPADKHYAGGRWQWRNKIWQTDIQAVYHYHNPNLFYTQSQNSTRRVATAGTLNYHPEGGKFSARLQWQNLPSGYRSPDPVQEADFLQQWDLDSLPVENYRHLRSSVSYNDNIWQLQAGQAYLQMADSIRLWQSRWNHRWQCQEWKQTFRIRWINGKTASVKRKFYHLEAGLDKYQGTWRPFVLWKREMRQRLSVPVADSLNYRLNQWETGLQWTAGQNRLRLAFRNNTLDSMQNGNFRPVDDERILKALWQRETKSGKIDLHFQQTNNIRHTERSQWLMSAGWTRTDSTQALEWKLRAGHSTSRIIRNEVVYRKVPQGQGQYVWNDYNGDGIAQDGEFEPAYYNDRADYIMVVLPSVRYLPSVRQEWETDLRFRPGQRWKNLPAAARWTFRLNIRSGRAALRENLHGIIIDGASADERNDQLSWEQTWKPRKPLTFQYAINLRALTDLTYNGKKFLFDRLQTWRGRYAFRTGQWMELYFNNRYGSTRSEFYTLRNVAIQTYAGGLRTGRKGTRNDWEARIEHSIRSANAQPMIADNIRIRYDFHSASQQNLLGLSLRYAAVKYNGNPYSPAGYRLLEGLRPGHNWIFDTHWSRKIHKDIRLQIHYQLRKTGTEAVVHTGNIALQAVF